MKPSLFSYSQSFSDPDFRETIELHISSTYKRKALLLFVCIPLDVIAYLLQKIFFGKKKSIIFTTEKWPDIFDGAVGYRKIFFGSPLFFLRAIKHKGLYIPASLIYVAIVLCWPKKQLSNGRRDFLIGLAHFFLEPFTSNQSILIVHSDALPFARALIFAAKQNQIKTVCIQHGVLRSEFATNERDGFMCDINIMRCKEDIETLKQITVQTLFYVLPDFFLPKVNKKELNVANKKIILVGEGFHIIDREFSIKYLEFLRGLEKTLIELGYLVAYRPHPSEKFLYKSYGFGDYDTSPLFKSFSVARSYIGYGSTLLFEAASVGIPSFYVRICDQICINMGNSGFNLFEFTYDGLDKNYPDMANSEYSLFELRGLAVKRFYEIIQFRD